jgi:transposase InsO family protein
MRIHSNATTCPRQRYLFRSSDQSCRQLAQTYSVSPTTISKWRSRSSPKDRSARPKTIRYAFSIEEQQFVLALRAKELSLDDIMDAIEPVMPAASRASIHRLLVRNGVGRLRSKTKEPPGKFKEYEPGFLHIDCFYLPKLDTVKRYCFVAIDRATRLVFLRVYDRRTQEVAVDFLGKCLSFYPFMINKVLTDNGGEFTNVWYRNRRGGCAKRSHPFGELCAAVGIDHRRTRIYTPKTNGLVERFNGLIQDETTKRHAYKDACEMIDALERWSVYYNFSRRHRLIGRVTPYEKVCDYYQSKPYLFIKEPAHLLDYCPQRGET